MNTYEAATILECIIDLSKTLDCLTNTNATPSEYYAFNQTKKVFMSLCELSVEPDKIRTNVRYGNFREKTSRR